MLLLAIGLDRITPGCALIYQNLQYLTVWILSFLSLLFLQTGAHLLEKLSSRLLFAFYWDFFFMVKVQLCLLFAFSDTQSCFNP